MFREYLRRRFRLPRFYRACEDRVMGRELWLPASGGFRQPPVTVELVVEQGAEMQQPG